MSESIITKQRATLSTQLNTEETVNSHYSQKNEPIDNTPFRLLGNEEKGFAITLANFIITEWAETEEKALEKLETEKYLIIANLIAAMQIIDKSMENEKKDNEKHNLKIE